jgi:Na+-translocating ferredoxin:NAD+ oxidoreductase RnfG subunit
LKGNFWLYPADENGNSMMAFPSKSQEDFTALKKGIVRNLIDPKNAKARRKAFREKLDKETIVSDEELKRYVDDIIREDLRTSSYRTLIDAKKNPKAVLTYYNFVNAYQLYEQGGYSGAC